jgi:hypothetical protein
MPNKSGNPSVTNHYFRVSSVIILIVISAAIIAASAKLKERLAPVSFNSAPSIQSPAAIKKLDRVQSQRLRWDLQGELKILGIDWKRRAKKDF